MIKNEAIQMKKGKKSRRRMAEGKSNSNMIDYRGKFEEDEMGFRKLLPTRRRRL